MYFIIGIIFIIVFLIGTSGIFLLAPGIALKCILTFGVGICCILAFQWLAPEFTSGGTRESVESDLKRLYESVVDIGKSAEFDILGDYRYNKWLNSQKEKRESGYYRDNNSLKYYNKEQDKVYYQLPNGKWQDMDLWNTPVDLPLDTSSPGKTNLSGASSGQPPARNVWYDPLDFPFEVSAWRQIKNTDEIKGTWTGATSAYIPIENELGLPETSILTTLILTSKGNSGQATLGFKADLNDFLDGLLAAYPEADITKDQFWAGFTENRPEKPGVSYGEYFMLIEDEIFLDTFLNTNDMTINNTGTRLKFIMSNNLDIYGVDGEHIVLYLEKKASETKPVNVNYKIGGQGEAGIVFYDKGNYSDGWRYLEVSLDFTRTSAWSNGTGYIRGLKTELGEGDYNTMNIIHLLGPDTAAGAAADYRAGGKNDWYLGNNKEMETCYAVLVKNGTAKRRAKKVPGFVKLDRGFWGDEPGFIWTSEQESAAYAFELDLEHYIGHNGGTTQSGQILPYKFMGMTLNPTKPLRPIRKF